MGLHPVQKNTAQLRFCLVPTVVYPWHIFFGANENRAKEDEGILSNDNAS